MKVRQVNNERFKNLLLELEQSVAFNPNRSWPEVEATLRNLSNTIECDLSTEQRTRHMALEAALRRGVIEYELQQLELQSGSSARRVRSFASMPDPSDMNRDIGLTQEQEERLKRAEQRQCSVQLQSADAAHPSR